jgi:hypothetical protein
MITEDYVDGGTQLCEAKRENAGWADQNQKLSDDLVLISKYCQLLEQEGPPVTHIESYRRAKLVDVPILEVKKLVEKYAKQI